MKQKGLNSGGMRQTDSSHNAGRSTPSQTKSQDVFIARLGSEAGNPSFAAPAAQTLLHAAAAAGHVLPSACRNGTCRSCLCRLHEGSVTYRIAWPGLSADEKREGFTLPCVAYPTSNVVLDWGFQT
jgi:ferredoxin